MAEYIKGITEELHNLGLQMIKESLESMDQMIQESPIRKKHWIVESHTKKQLITSLGAVTFCKTLFTNKEEGNWNTVKIISNAGTGSRYTEIGAFESTF